MCACVYASVCDTEQDATISHLKHALQAAQAEIGRWKDRWDATAAELTDVKAALEQSQGVVTELQHFKRLHKTTSQMVRRAWLIVTALSASGAGACVRLLPVAAE